MMQRNQNALTNAHNGWDSFINGLISDTESRITQVSKSLN